MEPSPELRQAREQHLIQKSDLFIWYQVEPPVGGPPKELLGEQPDTPVEEHFLRCHGTVPLFDETSYRLTVRAGDRESGFDLDELFRRFPESSIRGTLQCAGNRRAELAADQKIVGEILWDANGIGTAEWRGFRLLDLLEHVGIPGDARHVVLTGGDTVRRAEGEMSFERSIALATVRESADRILLAHSMNGEPLSPHHGFPLRVVAPEVIGASSVKWLSRITLQAEPSASLFQAVSYRQDPVGSEGGSGPMLEYLPINSAITRQQVTGSRLVLWGYAVPGRGARIDDVHVSVDQGPWERAELTSVTGIGQWTQWKAERDLAPGRHVVTVRAVDSDGKNQRFQDDQVVPRNRRGYLNNELPRITVDIP